MTPNHHKLDSIFEPPRTLIRPMTPPSESSAKYPNLACGRATRVHAGTHLRQVVLKRRLALPCPSRHPRDVLQHESRTACGLLTLLPTTVRSTVWLFRKASEARILIFRIKRWKALVDLCLRLPPGLPEPSASPKSDSTRPFQSQR